MLKTGMANWADADAGRSEVPLRRLSRSQKVNAIKRQTSAGALVVGALAALGVARADPSSATTLSAFGDSTYATGINSTDQIVGLYTNESGNHGFFYNGDAYTTLDDPQGFGTEALGINDSGQIVGFYNAGGSAHGFVYTGGTYTTLDDPAAKNITVAYDINDLGSIVGTYNDGSGFIRGYLYSGDTYTTVDDPLGVSTYATGINASGEIVGFYYAAGAPSGSFPGLDAHGFLYSSGAYAALNDPLGVNGTFPYAINGLGEIVGFYYDASDIAHGFSYDDGRYMTIGGSLGGSADVIARGINATGGIVGFYGGSGGDYFRGSGDHYYGFLAAVPEPSAWTMMMLGFASLCFASPGRAALRPRERLSHRTRRATPRPRV
jgi:probable HAF family extracellular repeat protein